MEESAALLSKILRAYEEEEEEDEENARLLQLLITLSRSPVQRAILSACNAVPSLLSLVVPHAASRLLILKLLRNLCAGDQSNQQSFLQRGGVQVVSLIMDEALSTGNEDMVLQVSLQLLGNACGGDEAQKEAVWTTFFPERFKALAVGKREDKILEPLCMLLYTCSHSATHRLEQLCRGDGVCLLCCCLQAAASEGILSGGTSDWIYLLLADLCLREPLLPLLFGSLRDVPDCSTPAEQLACQSPFTVEQSILLRCLLGILADKVHSHWSISQRDETSSLPIPASSIEFLAQTLQAAASRFYRDTTLDADNTQLVGTPPYTALPVLIVAELLSHGVIKLCMELLEGLGPTDLIHQAMQRSKADVSTSEDAQTTAGEGESGLDQVEEHSHLARVSLPYHGCRRDLVAVIGNASYQNHMVQDEVRHLGGLSLLLQQCVVDEMNPFLREWGFWAVRNLLEDNPENCKEVAELQLKGTLTPAELAQKGYKVEMDPVKGRPKLVNTSAVAEKVTDENTAEKVVNRV